MLEPKPRVLDPFKSRKLPGQHLVSKILSDHLRKIKHRVWEVANMPISEDMKYSGLHEFMRGLCDSYYTPTLQDAKDIFDRYIALQGEYKQEGLVSTDGMTSAPEEEDTTKETDSEFPSISENDLLLKFKQIHLGRVQATFKTMLGFKDSEVNMAIKSFLENNCEEELKTLKKDHGLPSIIIAKRLRETMKKLDRTMIGQVLEQLKKG